MTRRPKFSDQLRRAVKQSDLTRYEISKRTGIAQSILSRFVHSSAGVSMANIDKLWECLGLELTTQKTSKARAR